MKKADEIMKVIDSEIDHTVMPLLRLYTKKYFIYFSSILLISFLLIFVYQVAKERPLHTAAVIKSDLEQIEKNLAVIDKECNILAVIADRVPVDFLNIEKFSGSMVGCLNLAYPEKWKGPYLHRNPTLQGIFYDIVRARDGIFVVPGKGVKLPNGFMVGKDFDFSYPASVSDMMKEGGFLFYKGQALARQLKFPIGDWDPFLLKNQNYEKASSMLKEFNDALPFTQNNAAPTKA